MFNRIVVVVLTSLLFVSACGGDKQTSTFNRGTAVLS